MGSTTNSHFQILEACVTHARDLFVSAQAVHEAGRFSIAYHLATLCLEELGRREMLLELLVEIKLGDNVPLAGVWSLGLSLSQAIIMALNLATSGFWWWAIPRQRTRYYEKIEDLETGLEVRVEQAELKVFWDRRPALTKIHVQNLARCLSALPRPSDAARSAAYGFYLAGLTFVSLSDVHWRCERQAFRNFVQFLKLLLVEAEYMQPGETAVQAMTRALKERYGELDASEHDQLVGLMTAFEQGGGHQEKVSPGDVCVTKLICEDVFRECIVGKRRGSLPPANLKGDE